MTTNRQFSLALEALSGLKAVVGNPWTRIKLGRRPAAPRGTGPV